MDSDRKIVEAKKWEESKEMSGDEYRRLSWDAQTRAGALCNRTDLPVNLISCLSASPFLIHSSDQKRHSDIWLC